MGWVVQVGGMGRTGHDLQCWARAKDSSDAVVADCRILLWVLMFTFDVDVHI